MGLITFQIASNEDIAQAFWKYNVLRLTIFPFLLTCSKNTQNWFSFEKATFFLPHFLVVSSQCFWLEAKLASLLVYWITSNILYKIVPDLLSSICVANYLLLLREGISLVVTQSCHFTSSLNFPTPLFRFKNSSKSCMALNL